LERTVESLFVYRSSRSAAAQSERYAAQSLEIEICTMEQWGILRYIHKVGSPIKATVIGFDENGLILLETGTGYRSILSPTNLEDSLFISPSFVSAWLPEVGQEIDTVVRNFVNNTLCLSARPSDLLQATIQEWQAYYDYLDTLEIGQRVEGVVVSCKPFGILVNLGSAYLGVVDVGHSRFNGGDILPDDMSTWIAQGENISCRVSYFRFHTKQVGLGWIAPERDPA
jgi:hypothetical protein